jgi:biopolymer transport protein ExbD
MGPSSSSGDRFDPITSINITPLVDVSLVLVIIFMLTMPFLMEKSLRINPAVRSEEPPATGDQPILVEIGKAGVRIEGQLTPLIEITPALKRVIKERGVSAVAVGASGELSHGEVVAVMDKIIDSGVSDLNLLPPSEAAHAK